MQSFFRHLDERTSGVWFEGRGPGDSMQDTKNNDEIYFCAVHLKKTIFATCPDQTVAVWVWCRHGQQLQLVLRQQKGETVGGNGSSKYNINFFNKKSS